MTAVAVIASAARDPIAPVLIVVPALVFWAYCLFDLVQSDEREARTLTKQAWLVIVVLGSVAGAVAWYVAGRPDRRSHR